MKKNEIQLLLIVLGILAVVMSWQFAYKNFTEQTAQIEAENEELQATVDRLEILEAKKPDYLASIELMQTADDEIVRSFASGIQREDQILYIYNMELVDSNEVRVPSVNMSAAQVVPYAGSLTTSDGYELVDDGIGMYRLDTTASIKTTNNGLKNVLDYIYRLDFRKSVNTVSMAAGSDGYLNGSIQMSFYYLTGTEIPYVEPSILGVPTGTDNFFGVLNGGEYRGDGRAEDEEGEETLDGEEGSEDEGDSEENE